VVLVATVALACWLALQAYTAARSHRQTAEAVLRDYAEIAAAEYAREARIDLSRFFDVAFDEIPRRLRRDRLPPLFEVRRDLDDAMRALDCWCGDFRDPEALLRVQLPERIVDTELGSVPDEIVDEIVDEVLKRRAALPDERYGLFHLDAAAPGAAVAYATVQHESGSLAAVYGVLLGPNALRQLAEHWHESTELLPPAIAQGLPNDSLLFLSLRRSSGQSLFESPGPYEEAFAATDTLGATNGSLVVGASVRPEAAERIVIGGLPRSRLPVSLALLVLTLAVGAAGLAEIRRHDQLGRLREDFISSVSHELRTPLTQIRMLAELQADDKLRSDEERSRAIKVIRREAQRLTQLVENILQFSRIRAAPAMGMPPREVDMDEAVEEVLASFRPMAEASGATVRTDLDVRLTVAAQRDGVRRILMNLLDNALKYGPAGQTIQVRAHGENGLVRLVVEDEGPGVPRDHHESIWEPYRRLPRDVDSLRPGSGVGLAVVRSLAQQYGGRTWVEDRTPAGSRFVVELPKWEGAKGEPAEEDERRADDPSGAKHRAGAKNRAGAEDRAGGEAATRAARGTRPAAGPEAERADAERATAERATAEERADGREGAAAAPRPSALKRANRSGSAA
jgi:signal transduction histidine kinase